jgi:hypothetical protein
LLVEGEPHNPRWKLFSLSTGAFVLSYSPVLRRWTAGLSWGLCGGYRDALRLAAGRLDGGKGKRK